MRFQDPQWFDRITSTNTALLDRVEGGEDVPGGTVLATTEQTAGRGRGSRRWLTHPGLDLACSFLLRTDVEARRLCSLSMAVALGVCDMLGDRGVAARPKWPNDVVVGGRKICGILPELPRRRAGAVVVGVGLNVGMSRDEAEALDQPATSLFLEVGEPTPARDLLAGLLAALTPRLDTWEAGGFAALRADWEAACVWLGAPVTVVDGDVRRPGVLTGFGADGELLLDEGAGPVAVWTGHLRPAG